MKQYHEYVYDLQNRKIKGDFEGAYRNCIDVWPTQHNMSAPHFSYIRGLLLKNHEENNNDLTILDIGCGYGVFVNDLTNLNIGKVIGYDISPSAISKGKMRFGSKVDLRVGTYSDIDLESKSCDVILLLGVLWFLLNDLDSFFSKIDNLLSDSGVFIISLNVPENPIGKEIIGTYDDLVKMASKNFEIIDAFNWYQKAAIENNNISLKFSDMLLTCKKKTSGAFK